MNIMPVLLWTDVLLYILVVSIITLAYLARRKQDVRQAWALIFRNRLAVVSGVFLCVYAIIGLLDSMHFRVAIPGNNGVQHYSPTIVSVFDMLLEPLEQHSEKTYSAPFARHAFVKESIAASNGEFIRTYPRLDYGAAHLAESSSIASDVAQRLCFAALLTLLLWLLQASLLIAVKRHVWQKSLSQGWLHILQNHKDFPWRVFQLSLFLVIFMILGFVVLSLGYHIFGTNKVGTDVFYLTLKSIRTGLVIGTLTTLIMLPFSIVLGISAGYFGGRTDDIIQYIYTTLSSIPGVLLIAASILSLQIFISNHPNLFVTLAQRADARLLALCAILGLTSWTGLCRLLRAETLKVREIDYIQAAKALGSSHTMIIFKHILPNVMHIVLIAVVLDFSTLVLAEAVLSYVGVGVDPSAISWGNMINSARLELAREPAVWWPLLAAFLFMFVLVLSANLFSDAIRDGFDPRQR